tara:strand:- start:70269 stop:71408 length:1140 start_codon:yes stop_codon:yes gene_type:complete
MKKITMSQFQKIAPIYIQADKPIMLWGAPGIGKSGVVRGLAESTGSDLLDFRLLMRDAVDIHGLPKEENGRMSWALPAEVPLATDKVDNQVIMFLDEIVAAPVSTQTVAYQMLHERAIDSVKLNEKVRFIAAGNRETDGAVCNRMPSALANRMAHFDISVDSEAWLSWGAKNGVHPFMLSYVEAKPDNLNQGDKDAKIYTTQKAFGTPRSWENTSCVVTEYMKGVDTITDGDINMIEDIAASFMGSAIATDLRAHMVVGSKLPKPMDILTGKVKNKKFALHEQYFLSCGLLAQLGEIKTKMVNAGQKDTYHLDQKFSGYVDNLLNFAEEGFDVETRSAFVQRFVAPNWYGMQANPKSPVQAKWFKSVFGGSGDNALMWD